MPYKRVLTIQDISCVGQCSMTVALPILSACGAETCILPSAVLSSHTGGFSGVTFRDLTEDIPRIRRHWEKEKITFDAISTGYLGSIKQIEYVGEVLDTMMAPGGVRVVDPAMADHGKLYAGFDESYVAAMRGLCGKADILIPNLTEACMLTGREWCEDVYDEALLRQILEDLSKLGAGSVLLTGISFEPCKTGAVLWRNGTFWHYSHKKENGSFHGTGDIFAAAFVGAYMQDKTMEEAVQIASDYTALCIRRTCEQPAHWYGVKFETAIPDLIRMLGL